MDNYKTVADDVLLEAAANLMTSIFNKSPNFVVKRVQTSSTGLEVLVEGEVYGDDPQEKILYSSALDVLIYDKSLIACGKTDNESYYQVTWLGLSKIKRWLDETARFQELYSDKQPD